MYNLNRIIVNIFNCICAYARDYTLVCEYIYIYIYIDGISKEQPNLKGFRRVSKPSVQVWV